jgi:hypothetical protein
VPLRHRPPTLRIEGAAAAAAAPLAAAAAAPQLRPAVAPAAAAALHVAWAQGRAQHHAAPPPPPALASGLGVRAGSPCSRGTGGCPRLPRRPRRPACCFVRPACTATRRTRETASGRAGLTWPRAGGRCVRGRRSAPWRKPAGGCHGGIGSTAGFGNGCMLKLRAARVLLWRGSHALGSLTYSHPPAGRQALHVRASQPPLCAGGVHSDAAGERRAPCIQVKAAPLIGSRSGSCVQSI